MWDGQSHYCATQKCLFGRSGCAQVKFKMYYKCYWDCRDCLTRRLVVNGGERAAASEGDSHSALCESPDVKCMVTLMECLFSPHSYLDLEDPVSSLTSLGPEVHCLVLTCVLHSMAVMNNSQLLCFMQLCSKALHGAEEFGGHLGGFCCQHDLKLEYISYISIYGFTRPP